MPNFFMTNQGACMAFDFGETRIGVAQGESFIGIAHPLTTITGNNKNDKLAQIAQLIQKWQPNALVVGLPTHLDGTEHDLTHLARKFGRRLQAKFTLPVYWVDERLSSIYAQELLNQIGIKGRKQKPMLDQVAAQAILQSFFETGAQEWFDGTHIHVAK